MKYFKKTDLIVIICILAVSGISWAIYHWIFAPKEGKAEIYYYSELVETVDLSLNQDRTFSIPQDKDVVLHVYKDGSIAFVESDCPDQVCVHTGKIKTAGQFAACLPNGIVVKIVPAAERSEDDLDLVVGQ